MNYRDAQSAPRDTTWAMSLAEARHRVRELEGEKAKVVQAMKVMVQRFERTLTPPWPVRPVVQRLAQGHVYLRWRLPGRKGQPSYVDLAGDAGRALLGTLPGEVRQLFLRFAREAANLNLAHSLRQGEGLRLRQFLADGEFLMEAAQDLETEGGGRR